MAQQELDTNITEMDEIGLEIKDNALKQMKSEIDGYTRAVESAKKELARFEGQAARDIEKFDLMLKHFEYIAEPKFAFEKLPRYWEIVKSEKEDEIGMEKVKIQGYKDRKLKEIEELNKLIDTTQKRYDELLAQE
jgi:hypothetical protein